VVTERWKLIRDLESGTEHLFDLREDPGELHDLALDPPEVIAELRALAGAFHERAAGRAPWKSPTGNPTGHGVTALLKDGPDLFAADGDAAEEALTLARDMELPETVRMQLARLVVLLRKDRAADLLRDILPTASTDLRTLCARWAALVPAGDRLLVALAADPDPTVATTARASQAYLGDAGGLAENRDLPDSEVPLLEAWRLLARARHGDQRAIAAIAPLVATADVTDAEFLVAAWRLARELPDLRLHVAMYLRFAFGAGSSLDRHALGLLLATDPTEEVLPILRTLVGAGSEVLARGLDAYLTSRGSARWIEPVTDLIHRIAAAHVAAGANDFNKTEEILNAADAVARQQGLHDWGIYLERRILHAYARLPAVALPDDRYPPIIQAALVRLRDADRLTTAKPLLAEIEIITPDDLRPGALARIHLRLSNKGGSLPGGLLAAGPNLVVQVVDHRRGILQTLEIPIAGGATLPGESLCIPFVWTLAGRGNKAWIHVTVMTVGREPSKQQAKPVRLLGAPSPQVSIYQPRTYANMTAAALLGPRSVNGIGRKKADGEAFRFLVSGHLYGSRKGPHPARSFRSAIPRLNALDAAFLVNCGDMMWELNDQSRVESLAVFKQLRMPLYNAPGNHELSNRARYVEVFGPTHGVFRHGTSLFVILDTEDDPWNLTGPQLSFLKLVARWAESRSDLDNVFLFAHKVLFADDPEYEKTIGRKLNAHDRFMGRMNFVEDIEPVLDRLATKHRVFWFSGDVGTKAHSDTLFFDKNRRSGVTYVATGIGDLPRDLIVEVNVDAEGAVEMRPIPLAEGGAVKAMSAYGNEAWK